jgi:hypothetical protein
MKSTTFLQYHYTGKHLYTAYEEEAFQVTGQYGFVHEGLLGYAIA